MTKINATRNATSSHSLVKYEGGVHTETMTFEVGGGEVCISHLHVQGGDFDANFCEVEDARHHYRAFVRAGWVKA